MQRSGRPLCGCTTKCAVWKEAIYRKQTWIELSNKMSYFVKVVPDAFDPSINMHSTPTLCPNRSVCYLPYAVQLSCAPHREQATNGIRQRTDGHALSLVSVAFRSCGISFMGTDEVKRNSHLLTFTFLSLSRFLAHSLYFALDQSRNAKIKNIVSSIQRKFTGRCMVVMCVCVCLSVTFKGRANNATAYVDRYFLELLHLSERIYSV